MEDIKTYEINITNEDEQGIIAFSIVSDPAIGEGFIMLSDDQKILKLASEEQQVLMGPLLIPGQIIKRTTESGIKYNLLFTEEKILELARGMMKKGTEQNIDIEHNGQLSKGFYTQELWIAGATDKAHEHYPKEKIKKGTLMAAVHVPNKETWNAIKASDKTGFSIEAISGLKEIMSEMDMKVAMSGQDEKENEIRRIVELDASDDEKIGRIKQLLGVE